MLSALLGCSLGFVIGAFIENGVSNFAQKELDVVLAQPESYARSFILALITTFLALVPTLYFPLKKLIQLPVQSLFSGHQSSSTLLSSFNSTAIFVCLGITLLLSYLSSQSIIQSSIGIGSVILVLTFVGLALLCIFKLIKASNPLSNLKSFLSYYFATSFLKKSGANFVWILSLSLSLFLLSLGVLLSNSVQTQVNAAQEGNAPNVLTLGLSQPDKDNSASAFPESTEWVPYVMSRLLSVDGESIQEKAAEENADVDETGERNLRVREYFVNVRSNESLYDGEEISEGDSLFGAPINEGKTLRVSIEEEFAGRMGLDQVGTQFVMQIAGIKIDAVVTSLRTVQWFQFRPNFFIIVNGNDIAGAPLNYSALSTVPVNTIEETQQKIVSGIPHATAINLASSAEKIRDLLQKLKLSVQSSSFFLFFAALLVILSICWAKRSEKINEFALLKCLGCTPSQLKRLLLAEGLLASTLAIVSTWILVIPIAQLISSQFFRSDLSLGSITELGIYILGSVFLVSGLYYWAQQDLVNRPTQRLFQDSDT